MNDGNNGNDYAITFIANLTGAIVPGPFRQFALSVAGGNRVVAGNPFLLIAQATDAFGNPVSGSGVPTSITASASPTDPQVNYSINAPVNTSGFALLLGTLQTAGSYTLTAGGGSTNVTVAPASPDYFTVTASSSATTGGAFNVTVKVFDRFGNPVPGYTGTVSLTSTDPAAAVLVPSYTFTAADAGVHTFPVVLNSSTLASGIGTTIFVRDTTATAPPISGFSPAITVQGLVVVPDGFVVNPTGFTVTFSEPVTASDLTMYGSNDTTVQDVTLVGSGTGPGAALANPYSLPGTLYIDPTNPNTVIFKASLAGLVANNVDGIPDLPDDTYTATLVSGTGSNGFVDALGNHLDGLANGGSADYTVTFTTTYQNDAGIAGVSKTPILAIPDFARGPNSSATISVPNNKTAPGIPVILYDAPSMTDATFTLTYNPQILTPTATGTGDSTAAGSTFTMGSITSVDSTHSTVTFTYHNTTGHTGTIVLGDILATVPNSAASIYKTKELLALSNISITGGATVLASDGIHVDAYLGDVHVTASPAIDASDALDAESVCSGAWSGFSAYTLLDPAIIGGFIAGHTISVDPADVTALFTEAAHGNVPALPGIPASVTTVSVGGPDPTVSLGAAVETACGVISVPVQLDDPDPAGSTGMTEAHLALTYDPKVLSVMPADITLGSIPGLGTGWQITSQVDAATGQIGVNLFNLARSPITSTQAGSLVNIALHVVPGTPLPATAVQLVNQVTVNGRRTLTEVDDDQGPLTLSPGVDRAVILTGISPMTTAALVSTNNSVTAAAGDEHFADRQTPAASEETGSLLLLGSESGEGLAFISNSAVAGDTTTARAVAANVIVTGALAFQGNQSTVAATQIASQMFQIGNAPALNSLLYGNSPGQFAAEWLFLALARGTDALAEFNWLSMFRDNPWAVVSRTDSFSSMRDQQASDRQAVPDRIALVDPMVTKLMDKTDDVEEY